MLGRKGQPGRLDVDAIEAFFDDLEKLDMGQLEALRDAWDAIPRDEHEAAWAQVRAVASAEGLASAVDRLRQRAIDWTRRGSIQPGRGLPDYRTWIEVKIGGAEAIVDAALAAGLGDRLDQRTRDTLNGPWLAAGGGEYPGASR